MAMDWTECPDVEVIEGKVSGQPIVAGTRILAESIPENYEAFLDEGATLEKALAETLDCFPGAGLERAQRILDYFYSHQPQHRS